MLYDVSVSKYIFIPSEKLCILEIGQYFLTVAVSLHGVQSSEILVMIS